MGFKLIRMDASEPVKIPLKVGTHYIGRGTFLNCNDYRISRKHAAITVTETTVKLTSLHQNQCFYISLLTKKVMPLAKSYSVALSNNYHFGLLPNSYWYELIYCNDDNPNYTTPNAIEQVIHFADKIEGTQFEHKTEQAALNYYATRATSKFINTLRQPYTSKTVYYDDEDSDTATLDLEFDKILEVHTGVPEFQSLIGRAPVPGDPNTIAQPRNNTAPPPNNKTEGDGTGNVLTTPGKRMHILMMNDSNNAKKLKTEPESPPHDAYNGKKLKIEPESPKKAGNPEDPTMKKPNAQPHHPKVPESSMDVNTDPQNTMDVNSEHKDAHTDAQSAHAKNPLDRAKPGSSNDQPSWSADAGSPAATPRAPRERCLYGAACYRKNPQHKIQFSHPSDADYGTGAKGQCPYGAGCRRTDPRHWATHEHPPGASAQPVQPPRLPHHGVRVRVVQRRGRVYYINARAVHFHGGRYEVEEDGDSFDYEYEF